MAKAMIPIWLISWVVLLPTDSVNTRSEGKSGLDKFTYGNVAPEDSARLWAHLVLDYLFIGECDSVMCRLLLADDFRMDSLSPLEGDGTLAHYSTETSHQPRSLEITASEYGPHYGYLQRLYG